MKLNLKKIRFAANKKLNDSRDPIIPCDKCIVRACCTQRCPEMDEFLFTEDGIIDITAMGDLKNHYLIKHRIFTVPFHMVIMKSVKGRGLSWELGKFLKKN